MRHIPHILLTIVAAAALSALPAGADLVIIEFEVGSPTFMPYSEETFTFTSIDTGTNVVDEGSTTVVVPTIPDDGDTPLDTELLMFSDSGAPSSAAHLSLASSVYDASVGGFGLLSIEFEFIGPTDTITITGYELDGTTIKETKVFDGAFSGSTYSFVTDPGDWTGFSKVEFLADAGNLGTIGIDNVRVTPEPSSWALAILALVAVGARRRRLAG